MPARAASDNSTVYFIVAFPDGFRPTTEAVRSHLFGPRTGRERMLPVDLIAAAVYAQMIHQRPNDYRRIQAALGDFPGSPRLVYDSLRPERNKISIEKATAIFNVEYRRRLDRYLSRRLGESVDIYVFAFRVGGGDPTISDIVNKYRFRGVPHLGGK
jgi:hypothetical protein